MTGFRGQSVTGPGRAQRSQGVSKRIVVPFEDNRFLTQLLGEFDCHLALIEDRLGVEAHAHGNVIILTGSEPAVGLARDVLEQLYRRIANGEPIGAGDFDGLIRHARQETPATDGQAQIATRRRVVKARTPAQSTYMRAMERVDLVFGIGPAGTGKTYLAVAYAAHCLERGLVERLILSRPAVEAGERLGFLPGDMRDKVDPYLRPLYDALYDLLPPEKVERDIETGVIEVAPLAFMRGRTLANAFVILDEAQNTTSMQMKMFLTRLGENAKMVVTGDPSQIDLPPGQTSGLEEAVRLLQDVEGIQSIRFSNTDVVRRDLVARIVTAYDKASEGQRPR
ncbi:putative enzyme with nucleoside triphosphate hydrolase domain [Candidatus Filomicrobium marinum]|uniref:PhoH-like protein n=2 Tax=Filomicrobium TaxID=119044 RepID=A0A0D6JFM5_9HYPH|nr:putative enzyme with nucleoside triphosphate hydrolase domain [Candidatus Filomicrobium marinum]CPR19558.1 putative enzyme with nucleoside triphosphate hydrolase domain [Candidatus Filomicrobium marinum]SDO05033.1 phosphate starvation-inducible protein PhoH [Filomicrobium insigne]